MTNIWKMKGRPSAAPKKGGAVAFGRRPPLCCIIFHILFILFIFDSYIFHIFHIIIILFSYFARTTILPSYFFHIIFIVLMIVGFIYFSFIFHILIVFLKMALSRWLVLITLWKRASEGRPRIRGRQPRHHPHGIYVAVPRPPWSRWHPGRALRTCST